MCRERLCIHSFASLPTTTAAREPTLSHWARAAMEEQGAPVHVGQRNATIAKRAREPWIRRATRPHTYVHYANTLPSDLLMGTRLAVINTVLALGWFS